MVARIATAAQRGLCGTIGISGLEHEGSEAGLRSRC